MKGNKIDNGNHGMVAEDAIEAICYRIFGADFVIRSPRLIEPSGEKEMTDVLVVIDDVAIVIQSKSLMVEASELTNVGYTRIRKRYEQAKKQLGTTLNAYDRKSRVRATTALGVAFDLDWEQIRKKIGVVTLCVPDRYRHDPEFRFQPPFTAEDYRSVTVHAFLASDLAQMSKEVKTPGDMLLYLDIRERCVKSRKFLVGNELDFFAMTATQYPVIKHYLGSDEFDRCVISPGCWERYRSRSAEDIRKRDENLASGDLLDGLIRELRSSVDHMVQTMGASQEESARTYFRIIGKFGLLTKVERAIMSETILVKRKRTERRKGAYFMNISELADTAYFFLLSNEPDRAKRIKSLNFFCHQASHLVVCKSIIGLATEGAQLNSFSLDVMLLDAAEAKADSKPFTDYPLFKDPRDFSLDNWGYEESRDQELSDLEK